MIDVIILIGALFFGAMAIYVRDNVYSATSLAAAAATVGLYYAYLGQFASALLIFVIYIGAVMLLVLITAAMYGGVRRWTGRYLVASALLLLLTSGLGAVYFASVAPRRLSVEVDMVNITVMLLGVAAASLIVAVEVARRV